MRKQYAFAKTLAIKFIDILTNVCIKNTDDSSSFAKLVAKHGDERGVITKINCDGWYEITMLPLRHDSETISLPADAFVIFFSFFLIRRVTRISLCCNNLFDKLKFQNNFATMFDFIFMFEITFCL